jgi:3-methylcrotonyl-CoA carboxylase alpha subunit
MSITTLLVANRGEIACRIMRTARRMNLRTIAVYSEADRGALHCQLADEAIALRGNSATETYLDQQQLLEAARVCSADAIHPGYGFLSENADFAAAVVSAGLIFVGPRAQAIAAMGSKSQAKTLMEKAGVPLLPGYHGEQQDAAELHSIADQLCYPLLIKAAAGGGGRGLRVAKSSAEFAEALAAVKREAAAAFADNTVLLEKYLPRARHIEIQIFADQHGNTIHLHERDCSIQRRHQKLLEEAPAPDLQDNVRHALGQAAIKAAQAVAYTGAGTVEFLYQDGEFYFLEMNTRLQVEHPVTEAISGVDLVEWQLRVAAGEPLPLLQQQIPRNGHAIEARINAEGPAPDFLPSTGFINTLEWPRHLPGIRVDAGFRAGDRVSVYYDNLLGKIIAMAPSRAQALQRLSAALAAVQIQGVQHNANYLGAIVDTEAFQNADVHTAFLQQQEQAVMVALEKRQLPSSTVKPHNWGALSVWRNGGGNTFSRELHHQVLQANAGTIQDFSAACDSSLVDRQNQPQTQQRVLKAPLPGRVIKCLVNNGDTVQAGQSLLVLEAMKMEHTLRAAAACIVKILHCEESQMVQPDQLLIELEPTP